MMETIINMDRGKDLDFYEAFTIRRNIVEAMDAMHWMDYRVREKIEAILNENVDGVFGDEKNA